MSLIFFVFLTEIANYYHFMRLKSSSPQRVVPASAELNHLGAC